MSDAVLLPDFRHKQPIIEHAGSAHAEHGAVQSSFKAMEIAEDKRTWSDVSPDVDSLQCVEVTDV